MSWGPGWRQVNVQNPTARRMVYDAHLEGALDFSLEQHSLAIEPRSSANLLVFCLPSSSRPTDGRLVLSPEGSTGAGIAGTMVFSLHSVVDVDSPLRTARFEGRMYELLVQEVEVENPFGGDCDFALTLLPYVPPVAPEASSISRKSKSNKLRRTSELEGEKSNGSVSSLLGKGPAPELFPHPFGSDRMRLKMRRGEKAILQVSYLPFTSGSRTMRLCFEDVSFGPFVYELFGEASLPAPAPPVKITVDARAPCMREFPVPFANAAMEAAKKAFLERHPGAKDKAQAELIRALAKPDDLQYHVDVQTVHVSGPSTLTLSAGTEQGNAKRANPARMSTQHAAGHLGGGTGAASSGAAPAVPPNMLQLTLNPAKVRLGASALGAFRLESLPLHPPSACICRRLQPAMQLPTAAQAFGHAAAGLFGGWLPCRARSTAGRCNRYPPAPV